MRTGLSTSLIVVPAVLESENNCLVLKSLKPYSFSGPVHVCFSLSRISAMVIDLLVFKRRQCNLVTFEQDKSGRLLKYDPQTQQTTVIARDLFYPNGIAVSQDSSFLLFSYTSKSRYYLFNLMLFKLHLKCHPSLLCEIGSKTN